MSELPTFGGVPATPSFGHVGWPVDEDDARDRQIRGLPCYRPAHAVAIDQAPYREFAAKRGPNSL